MNFRWIGGWRYNPLARGDDEILRFRYSTLAALAVFAVLLLFTTPGAGVLRAHDAAHTDTHAEICDTLIDALIAADTASKYQSPETSLRSDCVVLLDIKDELLGTASLPSDDWGADTAFDSWHGITIGDESGTNRVEVLNLPGTDFSENPDTGVSPPAQGPPLNGKIPSGIGKMTGLQRLILHENQLTGEIPSELGNLTSLLVLAINENQLIGSIPSSLGSLSKLRVLYLQHNQLTGEIPAKLGNLDDLIHLHLYRNQLTGSIPASLANLSILFTLYLHDNELTGMVPNLNALTYLIGLGLGGNDLDLDWSMFESAGTGAKIYNLETLSSSMRYLYLHESGLTGSIPNWMASQHTGLIELWLHDNELTGTVPNLNALKSLIGLGLGGNDLDLDWSMFKAQRTGARAFDLETVRTVNGGGAVSMQRLYLHDSGLTGKIPNWIGNVHTDLRVLWLQNNRLTGQIPSNFDRLTKLLDLQLQGNMLTGGWEGLSRSTAVTLSATKASSDQGHSTGVANRFFHVKLTLPEGADAARSSVRLAHAEDPQDVYVPPHSRYAKIVSIIPDAAIDIVVDIRDAQGEAVAGTLNVPAVVCVAVPASYADQDVVVLKYDGQVWEYLDSADPPSGFNPGTGNIAVCGMTDSLSQFVPAVVEVASAGAGIARIRRIEPSIQSVKVTPGDVVELGFDIWGRQDILDNNLGEGKVFAWDDGGAGGSFRPSDRPNTIIYTAPVRSGTHTVTVTSPAGSCWIGEGLEDYEQRCITRFTITVRRPSVVPGQRSAPKGPVGEIPSMLADTEGRHYKVFTPEHGGFFEGGAVTISAGPGVVPNLEIVGIRADIAGTASNVGMTAQRYTLVGNWYDVLAVDANGGAIPSYDLNSPLEVCLPLAPEARPDDSDVAIVANNPDGTLTALSASVRITASLGINVCGNLGTLPATIAVGTAGSPGAIPTPTPEIEPAFPDTGGTAPTGDGLLLLMIAAAVVAIAGVFILTPTLSRRERRDGWRKRG